MAGWPVSAAGCAVTWVSRSSGARPGGCRESLRPSVPACAPKCRARARCAESPPAGRYPFGHFLREWRQCAGASAPQRRCLLAGARGLTPTKGWGIRDIVPRTRRPRHRLRVRTPPVRRLARRWHLRAVGVSGHLALGGEAMTVASASCQVLVKRTLTRPGRAT